MAYNGMDATPTLCFVLLILSLRYFSENVRDDYAAGQLDSQVEGVLQEMRELSICGAS